MPAIKLKKAAAEHQAEKEREERERESESTTNVPPKPKEALPGGGLLRGLDTNILFEKRKRTIPPSEQKLLDWMESNLEAKEDCHVNLNSLYDYFGEACTFDGTAVLDQPLFNKRIAEKFGKSFALKESSPYKGIIKEKKAAADKKKGVKADSLKLKMKDIIEEALKEAGNPEKGVRFLAMKQYIACNYPALRVDLRPGYLKAALERGVRYGHIQLVRGVGVAGYYRLPVDVEPDETEEKTADKEGDQPGETATTEHQNGDAEGTEDKPKDEAAADKAKPKKKSRKRKSGETGEGEEGEKVEGEKAEGEEGAEEGKKKKKKTKKHKRRRPRVDSYHSAPQKIEDTFALAMTYMCEPKQTSFGKIRKYIAQHYPHVDVDSELKSKMESGERKGYWEHVTGQGLAGSFRLMIDEFDPNSTDNIEDMICSAIIACNEPKQSSANLLKKYVMEYHPEFKIESRPHLFKNALERALRKQMIIQLSGIGASGSFQMWSVFSPSPALLAGEEQSDDEDVYVDKFKEEAYVPRGTKSRRLIKKPVTDVAVESRPKPKKRSHSTKRSDSSAKRAGASKSRSRPQSAKSSSRSKGKVNYAEEGGDEGEEEEFEDEEDEPAPKKARKSSKSSKGSKGKKAKSPKKASPKKKAQRPVSRSQLEEDEEIEEEKEDTTSKKAKKSKPAADEEEEEPATPVKGGRGRSKARPNYAEEKGEDDEEEEKSSKGRKSSGSRRASKTVSYSEKEDEEEEDEQDKAEYTPRKSKSRGGDEEEQEETSTSPKKKGRKRR